METRACSGCGYAIAEDDYLTGGSCPVCDNSGSNGGIVDNDGNPVGTTLEELTAWDEYLKRNNPEAWERKQKLLATSKPEEFDENLPF